MYDENSFPHTAPNFNVEAAKATVDAHFAQLDKVRDLDGLCAWFERLERLCSIHVKLNSAARAHVAGFCKSRFGIEPGIYCIPEEITDPKAREQYRASLSRTQCFMWLAGNCVDTMNWAGYPHQLVHKFAKELREMPPDPWSRYNLVTEDCYELTPVTAREAIENLAPICVRANTRRGRYAELVGTSEGIYSAPAGATIGLTSDLAVAVAKLAAMEVRFKFNNIELVALPSMNDGEALFYQYMTLVGFGSGATAPTK